MGVPLVLILEWGVCVGGRLIGKEESKDIQFSGSSFIYYLLLFTIYFIHLSSMHL